MTLRKGANQGLRPDTPYTVSLFTPAPMVQLVFTTPGLVSDTAPGSAKVSDTLTWTISVEKRGDVYPPWMDVAALAVLIERFPDVIPYRDGAQLSPSKGLRELVEIVTGHSSNAYYQDRLSEAAAAAQLHLSSGDQTKQSRVAAAYATRFPEHKLESLRRRVLMLLDEE